MKSPELAYDQSESEWTFWALASTFLWIALLWIIPRNASVIVLLSLFAYPLACINSARLLFKRRRKLKGFFAVINLTCAFSWVAFAAWLGLEFFLRPAR